MKKFSLFILVFYLIFFINLPAKELANGYHKQEGKFSLELLLPTEILFFDGKVPLMPKTKKVKLKFTISDKGMFSNGKMMNGVRIMSYKDKKNKKVVADGTFILETKKIACLDFILADKKAKDLPCYIPTKAINITRFKNPYYINYFKTALKQLKAHCPKQKSRSQGAPEYESKEYCLEWTKNIKEYADEAEQNNHPVTFTLFFIDENKRNLIHVIMRTYASPWALSLLDLGIPISSDMMKIALYNQAYGQVITEEYGLGSYSPFAQISSISTQAVAITNKSESDFIGDTFDHIYNLVTKNKNKINLKLDPEIEKKLYSIMAAAEKKLPGGKTYLQDRK